MPTLTEQLISPPKRSAVVSDLVRLVDEEVGRKGGISGLGIKAAYTIVKAMKPSFVSEVVDGMLDDCVRRLEPIYAECVAEGPGPHASRLQSRAGRVADALLGVTDARAEKTTHTSLKKTYLKLRPTAKRNVEEAVPGLGKLLDKHTKD